MSEISVRQEITALKAYVPGLSIAEIQEKYNLPQVIKMASNENPLGMPPLAQEAVVRHASGAFRYPQGGNPRVARALGKRHGVDERRLVIGNGSDEIIDLLIRILAIPGTHNIVCFNPCFSIYPIQGRICGVEIRRQPLEKDFSFNFAALLDLVDENTRIVFVTTPDNPSGYCPPREQVIGLAHDLARKAPDCLLVVDEAYMDFADDEKATSMLAGGIMPSNTAFMRTFSKSFGLAGMRVGYGILPDHLADFVWRARLPFSVNILAEEAALAALNDKAFYDATQEAVRSGRKQLYTGLTALGCKVWPSQANFLMFGMPEGAPSAAECFETLLARGIIIRPLKSYGLPDLLRVSIGNQQENLAFLAAMADVTARRTPEGAKA
ncbi:histidinol-phosphate transaminase [Desulfovibrio desulfuricans]|uniref:Histidinol-phosphate aminotransferase n=1 Tax=Desulfovibrio desulfuricans TaxID=876 RepID=A0A4P7UKI6_DESDE|nr:histidinol-phosphate transaminase [Desulfovibrio desulfuricans]QCC86267.1 histidinol-phosphate transaminase [Desulfovibrio desulfuricans]